jgi:phage shock protein A
MDDPLLDRIKAHRSAPDVYDPPTFDQMADRILELEANLLAVGEDREKIGGKLMTKLEELEAKRAAAEAAVNAAADTAWDEAVAAYAAYDAAWDAVDAYKAELKKQQGE